MLPVVVLQLFVAGASAAALTFQVQNPLDIIFGDPEPHQTVYETLTNDERFSYLTKAINFVGDEIVDVLNDASHSITFFAVPDYALHQHHGHNHEDYKVMFDMALAGSDFDHSDIALAFGNIYPDFSSVISAAIDPLNAEDDPQEPDDPNKERRKKVIRLIVNAVLQYHVLPSELDEEALRHNTTYPTHLAIPAALGGQPQRVRVSHTFKHLKFKTLINGHSEIVKPSVKASNGLIHVVNHPVIPPSSIFQELFQFQQSFSIFTSALQRTGLADNLDLRYVWDKSEGHGHFEGTSAATVFALPNKVFNRLPRRLRWYLFSPVGTPALRKLLEYHIVPEIVAHADYLFNRTATMDMLEPVRGCTCDLDASQKHPHTHPITSYHATLPTLLHNQTLYWEVEKTKVLFPGHHERYESIIKVNGEKVELGDIIALNGAIHIVNKFLVPLHRHEGDFIRDAGDCDDIWQD